MKISPSRSSLLIILLLLFFLQSSAQLPFKLIDGRAHRYCEACQKLISDKPAEVLFGIQINENGDVYFSMNNKTWFDKIFKNDSYAVTIDIISKDRYACNKKIAGDFALPKGTMLMPVYRPELIKGMDGLLEGHIFTKIGKVPASLRNKQLEGNLLILNGPYVCYYSNFVNIDRTIWKLLPMGLFTDSLLSNVQADRNVQTDYFSYSKKIQIEIPFSKASATFSNADLKKLYDSLQLENFRIEKMDVRAYASVEGSEKINKELMARRAEAMIQALKIYQPGIHRIKVLTAENWLDFFKDIEGTTFNELNELSRSGIKQKLTDQALATALEPVLSKHRKVVITMYVKDRSAAISINDTSIAGDFNKAVAAKDIAKARMIQKELVERIIDKKMPLDYIGKLEVPQTKEFSPLLNDREVYKYLLKVTSEYEALDNFLSLKKLDPENGRINYNICALRFFTWQYGGDTAANKFLLKDINRLSFQGIHISLVKRMLINYYILKCEDQMTVFNYPGKDSSLDVIRTLYVGSDLDDEDMYSLAKYYSFYAHQDWAEEMITPRIDKVGVSEDLVFYYVNLLFFQPYSYNTDEFYKACINAINLNRQRFCDFFLPNDKGGASIQLLEYEQVKELYCEECK